MTGSSSQLQEAAGTPVCRRTACGVPVNTCFLSGRAPLAFCPPRLTHNTVGQWLPSPLGASGSEIPCHILMALRGPMEA